MPDDGDHVADGAAVEASLDLLRNYGSDRVEQERAQQQEAERLAIKDGWFFTITLPSVIGVTAAKSLRETSERAAPLFDEWSKALRHRERLRERTRQLANAVAQTESKRRSVVDFPDEAHWGLLVDSFIEGQRRELAQTIDDLSAFEEAMSDAFGNSVERMRNLADDHEYDGLRAGHPERLGRRALKRRNEALSHAVRVVLPVVEAVYKNEQLRRSQHFEADLIQALGGTDEALLAHESEFVRWFAKVGEHTLEAAALAVRNVCGHRDSHTPEPPSEFEAVLNVYEYARKPTLEATRNLLEHLRSEALAPQMQPLGSGINSGEGTGKKVACYHLIGAMTGLSWRTVQEAGASNNSSEGCGKNPVSQARSKRSGSRRKGRESQRK